MARTYFQYLDNIKGTGRMWKEQMIQEAFIQLGPEKLEALMAEVEGGHEGIFEAVLLSNVVSEKMLSERRTK